MVNVVSGSMKLMSGTMVLLAMPAFRLLTSSVKADAWETSAEEPAVVDLHLMTGPGTITLSTPFRSRTWQWLVTTPPPNALPQSVGLPPPTATIRSQPFF